MRFLALLLLSIPALGWSQQHRWIVDESPLLRPISASPAPERRLILKVLAPEIRRVIASGELDSQRFDEAGRTLNVQTIQLKNRRFIFVTGGFADLCGAANCRFWLLDPRGHLLLASGGMGMSELKKYHHGLPSLEVGFHTSAFETYLQRWQYDGTRYRIYWCGKSSIDVDGDWKSARTKRIVCSSGM